MLKFWKNMDEGDQVRLAKITGIVVALFAVFTLLSTVSYLFTWKADQSLLASPVGDQSVEVSNIAGQLGYRWADFLVRKCFGLGSLALIIILFAVAARLLLRRWRYSLLKTILVAVSGALIVSFILAFVSDLFGMGNAFGGGLGGQCGESVVRWSASLVGGIVTGLILAALAVLWLLIVSKPFSRWVAEHGKPKVEEKESEEVSPAEEPGPSVLKPKAAPVPEPDKPVTEQVSMPDQPVPGAQPQAENVPSLEIERGEGLSTEVKKELPRIDNRVDLADGGLPNFKFPTLDLLDDYATSRQDVSYEELTRNNNKIRATLENFRILVKDVKAIVGPTVTLYKVYPAPGVKIADIKRLQDDIGIYLHAKGVRVVALADSVGIEVANDKSSVVPLKAVLNDAAYRESKAELPVAIGYTITQKVKVFDLADSPHLLIAGATRQGKSVGLNVIVTSLLYAKHPSELKFVFIDPKMVEFTAYENLIRHYLAVLPDAQDEQSEIDASIVKHPDKADKILRSLCVEMNERDTQQNKAYVNNIKLYNDKYKDRKLPPVDGHRFLPYLVVVIDEYADLTMSVGGESKNIARNITNSIIRLAQKGRAAGIHMIIATQRPSVDVITGQIKANFPTRIAYRVISRVDSQTILDSPGAQNLIGKGDMLYYSGVEMERIQCALILNPETDRITRFIGGQQGHKKSYSTPYYLPAPESSVDDVPGAVDMKNLDERFEEAARLVVMSQRGSTSDLQRRLGMGYAKAGRVMDQLEAAGVVGPQEGSKPRQVLISSLDELENVLATFRS